MYEIRVKIFYVSIGYTNILEFEISVKIFYVSIGWKKISCQMVVKILQVSYRCQNVLGVKWE